MARRPSRAGARDQLESRNRARVGAPEHPSPRRRRWTASALPTPSSAMMSNSLQQPPFQRGQGRRRSLRAGTERNTSSWVSMAGTDRAARWSGTHAPRRSRVARSRHRHPDARSPGGSVVAHHPHRSGDGDIEVDIGGRVPAGRSRRTLVWRAVDGDLPEGVADHVSLGIRSPPPDDPGAVVDRPTKVRTQSTASTGRPAGLGPGAPAARILEHHDVAVVVSAHAGQPAPDAVVDDACAPSIRRENERRRRSSRRTRPGRRWDDHQHIAQEGQWPRAVGTSPQGTDVMWFLFSSPRARHLLSHTRPDDGTPRRGLGVPQGSRRQFRASP